MGADCENYSERKGPILLASRCDDCATPPISGTASPERLTKIYVVLILSSNLYFVTLI